MTENDPQEGPKIEPKTTKNRHQNGHRFRCENQEDWPGFDLQTLGREHPSREAPQGLREGARAAQDRPPGTHVRAKRTLNIEQIANEQWAQLQIARLHMVIID